MIAAIYARKFARTGGVEDCGRRDSRATRPCACLPYLMSFGRGFSKEGALRMISGEKDSLR